MKSKTKKFILARLKFFIGWIAVIVVSAGALTAIMYFIDQGVDKEVVEDEGELEIDDKVVMGKVKRYDLLNRDLLLEDFDYYIDTYSWDEDTSCVITGVDPECASGGSCGVIEEDCNLDNLDDFEDELEFSVTMTLDSNNKIESIILANGLYGM